MSPIGGFVVDRSMLTNSGQYLQRFPMVGQSIGSALTLPSSASATQGEVIQPMHGFDPRIPVNFSASTYSGPSSPPPPPSAATQVNHNPNPNTAYHHHHSFVNN